MEFDKITLPLWLIAAMLANLNGWKLATWFMLANATLIAASRLLSVYRN